MEKDQDQKLTCKVCGKSCSSGMSLGGHMRSHLVKKSTKKAKVHNNKLAFIDNDDNNDSYVLNENTENFLKVSTEEDSPSLYENETKCKECGKEFPSVRSLCGHMRWHSVKTKEENFVCGECGKEFDSERALLGHVTHHSRKSRASNECSYNLSDDSENEVSDFDLDEIQEAALILVMISQGLTQRDLSNLVLRKSEGENLVCNLDMIDREKSKMKRQNKLASWVSSSRFMFENEKAELEMDDSDDEFDQEDDFGNEFSGFELKNGKRKRVQKLECDESLVGIKTKGLKKSKRHACRICSKVFQTRKGLGGHKKAHKNDIFENKHEPMLISCSAN